MIHKWLSLAGVLGHAEDLGEELLDDTEMGLLLKSGIKGQNRPGSLEAVTDEVEFLHGVQVLEVHLDGGSVWRLAHPAVQILAFPGLKEDDVVAVVELYVMSAFAGE